MSDWYRVNELSSAFSVMNDKSKQLKTADYYASGKYPIIDQSADFICGYSDNEDAVYRTPLPIVVFGDHTRCVKYIDFPFIAGADGTQLLKAEKNVDPKFLFFIVQRASYEIGNYGYDSDLIPEIYTSRRVTHGSATAVFSDQKFPAIQQKLDGRICCSEKT